MEGILPNSFYKASITLIPKPEKRHYKKTTNIPCEHRCIPNKNLEIESNDVFIKRIIHDQKGFISGMQHCFTFKTSVIHHINKSKRKEKLIISIYRKTIYKYPISIPKILRKLKIKGNFFNLINSTYKKATINIILK